MVIWLRLAALLVVVAERSPVNGQAGMAPSKMTVGPALEPERFRLEEMTDGASQCALLGIYRNK